MNAVSVPSYEMLKAQQELEHRRKLAGIVPSCSTSLEEQLDTTWIDQLAERSNRATEQQLEPADPPSDALPSVKTYPSILAAMVKTEQAAVGRVWLLLRHLDTTGQGWIAIQDVRRHLSDSTSSFKICGWRRIRQILKQGRGTFWERDGQQRLWIYGAAAVAKNLAVERLQGKPVAIPLASLTSGMEQANAAFYAAFHAGRDSSPIARATIHDLTGMSERSQRHYDHVAKVQREHNFDITQPRNQANAQDHAWDCGRGSFEFIDYRGKQGEAGVSYNAQRLPNSYSSPYQCSALGRQRKVNRKLVDLVTNGAQGNNGRTIHQLYYTDAKRALRAVNQGDRVYLRRSETGKQAHSYSIWTNFNS